MLLYHASTVMIKEFFVPYGGIHVGGLYSALEAALRKVRSHDGDTVPQVFIHRVQVDLGRSMSTTDMGGSDSWNCLMYVAQNNGCDSLEYWNKFEPDLVNSYVLWEPSRIKVLDIKTMSQDEAEDMVNEFYDENGFY